PVGVRAPYDVWHGAREFTEVVEALRECLLLAALCGDVRDVALQQPGTAMLIADGRADLGNPLDLAVAGNQPVRDMEGTSHAYRIANVLLDGLPVLRVNERLKAQPAIVDECRGWPARERFASRADEQHGPGGIVVTKVRHAWQVIQQKLLIQQT